MGDHDLRVAGADGRDRRPGAARRRRGGDRPLGAAPRRDRRGHRRPGVLRAFWDGDEVGAIPARLLTDECPRYAVERSARVPPRGAPDGRCRRPRERSARAARLAAACARARSSPPLRPARPVAHRAPPRPRRGRAAAAARSTAGSPSRSTGRAARLARPAPRRRSSRSSRRRATSPAPAASRSASPTASTSATRRSPRSAGSSPRRSRGWRSPARRSASRSSRATSRSTTTPTAARSTRRPSSAASGSSRTCAACRGGWREGDAILLARSRSPLTFAGSEAQARWGTLGGSPSLDLASRGRARPPRDARSRRCASLVHDAAEGGLAVALAEAALWSGRRRRARARRRPAHAVRRGRRPGHRRAAPRRDVEPDPTGADVDVARIGVVGGDAILGDRRSTSSQSAYEGSR